MKTVNTYGFHIHVRVGISLSFRLVSKQVLWAQVSLTTVFGMGTGGPSPPSTPTARHRRAVGVVNS